MAKYIGVQPFANPVSYRTVEVQTAAQNQTMFLVNYDVGAIDIFVNGVLESASAYDASSGTDIIFNYGMMADDKIIFIKYSAVRQIFNPQTDRVTNIDPTVNDSINLGYDIGSKWINTSTGAEFTCLDNTPGAAVWRQVVANNFL